MSVTDKKDSFILFADCLDQKIRSNIVHVWHQNPHIPKQQNTR